MRTTNGSATRIRWPVAIAIAVAAVALGLLAFRALHRHGGDARRQRVNVVLITLDTLRADRLSCYGSKSVATPGIDGLAARGIRFTNAATTVPLTLPAHASIMTGLYPPAHGLRDNVGSLLDGRLPTIASLLRARGWSTAGFVSAFVLDRRWGIARGFDHYADDFDLRGMLEANAADMASVQRDGAQTVAAAVSWLDRRPADQPFFLWLHLYDPHEPYTPREPFRSRYPGRSYDAEVAYTDSLVGDFRRALEERGLLDRSLIVLTSDHGEGLGDHGESSHGYFVYDSTVKAALIVKLPSGESAGRVVDKAVSHVDLLPTILEVTGVTPPADIDGRSLVPLLEGRTWGADRPVYAESLLPSLRYGWAPLRALRSDAFKFIDAPRAELYDLARDPAETRNLAGGEPERTGKLASALADLRRRTEKRKRVEAAAPAPDAESLARLQSLGYLAGRAAAGTKDGDDRSATDPKDRIEIHEWITEAQGLIGSHDHAAAERLLARVVARDEAISDAHQMMGELASLEGHPERAVPHFRRALELDPTHERALSGLAGAYAALGRFDDALAGYRRLLDLKGTDPRVSLALADTCVAMGRLDDAAMVLEQASAEAKTTPFFLNKLGEVRVAQGRDDEALSLFERATSPSDDFALPHFNMGVLQEKRGNARAAVEQYERAIALEPRFCRAAFNLGRLYASAGDAGRARVLWESALESCPDFVQGHYYLAKLLMDTNGDLARAEKLARRGIALDPERSGGPLGYYVLADILQRTGRPDEARRAMAAGRAIQRGTHSE